MFLTVDGADASEARSAEPLSVVTFGTSLTARGGWQDALQSGLEACLGRSVNVAIVAKSGATSNWAVAHANDVAALQPDIVLVEFAANDAALDRWMSLAGSKANIALALDIVSRAKPRPRIVLLGMNPAHGLRGWMRPRLDTFTDEHARIANQIGADFLDLRPVWRALGEERLAMVIPDGLHPEVAATVDVIVPPLIHHISKKACSDR